MMAQKDQDLGLSLSLSFPSENRRVSNASSLHLNLIPSSSPSHFSIINRNSCIDAFTSSDRRAEACGAETRSFLKEIDVNCALETAEEMEEGEEEEEEGGMSSPNNTVSSVSGKRSDREDQDSERASPAAASAMKKTLITPGRASPLKGLVGRF